MGVKHWGAGVLAAAVISGLSGASAPAVEAAPVVEADPQQTPSEWQPTYDIDPSLADELIAATPTGATPDPRKAVWDCGQPINIDYAAAPGVDLDKLLEQLAYPVRYLQGLGYYAAIGNEVPYTLNMPVPSTHGTIVIVVTGDRTEQSGLANGTHRGAARSGGVAPGMTSAGRVSIMSTNGMSSDVILHEIGHILGLDHKDGTVMTETAISGLGFDAAETAAIDCRP